MAKKIEINIESYGLYSPHTGKKEIPSIIKFTDTIPVGLDIEFGYVLRIKKAKGKKITFKIEHPPFKNENGDKAKPFTGELYVRSNDFRFFLGDTFWNPLQDKIGNWTLTTWLDNKEVAKKTLIMV